MLVPSMNHNEMYNEIMKDASRLKATTCTRIFHEYDRERKKLKIDPHITYRKVYPIKTKAKNTWFIFISKAAAVKKYKDLRSAEQTHVLYYYDANGIQAIDCSTGDTVEHYTAHFFKRYNERLELGIDTPLERLRTYFMNSGPSVYSIVEEGHRQSTIGVSSEGFLLGELWLNEKWHINKTFVSRNMAKVDQVKLETSLYEQLIKAMDIEDSAVLSADLVTESKNLPRLNNDEQKIRTDQ
jgi:hypothetical protein